MNQASPNYITLSELQLLIKGELERALPLSYWVTAEVSEMKVNYSGHCYIQLVEKSGKNQQPKAAASAVAWRSVYGSIAAHFRAATGGEIAAGMKLLLRVSIIYHELYGLSLVIGDIDPAYTLGDLEQERQRTIARLQEEGVFDMNRELELPVLLQRIAVVSSRNAAGYQDFMQEIGRYAYRFELTLFDAFMQGDAAEGSIISALDFIATDYEKFDAVVIIRGGGSQSDLACFNAYRLCSHIAQFPLPVITGIGHDKDRSVADMVAAVELKTPTAVAGYLIERVAEEDEYLKALADRLRQFATGIFDAEKMRLMQTGITLMRHTNEMTRSAERRLNELGSKIAHHSRAILFARRLRLDTLGAMLPGSARRQAEAQQTRLEVLSARIAASDPERILALGFAVVRSDGRALRNSSEASPGQSIEVTLHRGKIIANVEKTK